ncbi:hypothetical protein [Accumulibacter sp.]|uniref:hypothetical protein n=1 Tax=Accumulibacter sp. TaxID=2053492 RepID=UPI00257C6795|nr:hypothetical protein [Accumulibacter sp.]
MRVSAQQAKVKAAAIGRACPAHGPDRRDSAPVSSRERHEQLARQQRLTGTRKEDPRLARLRYHTVAIGWPTALQEVVHADH